MIHFAGREQSDDSCIGRKVAKLRSFASLGLYTVRVREQRASGISGTGSGVTPDDIDGAGNPIATAAVTFDAATDEFRYVVPFLPPGIYTLAFTCQADLDEVPEPENGVGADDHIVFQLPVDRTVIAGQTTECDFLP